MHLWHFKVKLSIHYNGDSRDDSNFREQVCIHVNVKLLTEFERLGFELSLKLPLNSPS